MTHLKKNRTVHRIVATIGMASLLSLLLLSCKKDVATSYTELTSQRKTDKNLLAKFPAQNQRLIYNLLTPTEKSDLWIYHLINGLEQISASKAQRKFVESLVPKLTAGFLGSPLKEVEYEIIQLSHEVSKLFSKDERIYLFYTLDADYKTFLTNYHREEEPEGEFSSSDKCACSTKSDYCTGIKHCASGDCTTTSIGCGFMLFFSCNGICS